MIYRPSGLPGLCLEWTGQEAWPWSSHIFVERQNLTPRSGGYSDSRRVPHGFAVGFHP